MRFFALLLLSLLALPARAQLATSFYNVTGIEKRILPNAVQLTIRTDGAVAFGTDVSDFLSIANDDFSPKPTTTLRLRLLGARARLPAFIDLGAYPVDSALVTLGTDELQFPFFPDGGRQSPGDPKVDITLRFFVPMRVQRLSLGNNNDIDFEEAALGPRDISVELGPDRRSIIVTAISDRVDGDRAARIRRSPPELQKHRLSVAPVATQAGKFRVDALHTPLADLADALGQATGNPLTVRPDAAEIDVSLLLPSATSDEVLRILATGYGLTIESNNTLGRSGLGTVTERLPVRNLSPEAARLLFPDFLLPSLRVDRENNALIAVGSPALIGRLRTDLAKIDLPRQQVRVEAQVWEFATTEEANQALRASRAAGGEGEAVDTDAGTVSVRAGSAVQRAFSVAVTALAARGRARLTAKPFVVVASGANGTIFLGQRRFVQVLRNRNGQQVAQALQVSIGYSLNVTPTVGRDDDITLEMSPRFATVDEVERGTGLPTLGIREISTILRVRPDDAVVVAGLDADLRFDTKRRTGGLFRSRRATDSKTALVVLVTAKKV